MTAPERPFDLACTCGGHWHGTVPEPFADRLLEIWKQHHTGPGHAPARPPQAARKRRRADRPPRRQ